MSLFIWSVSIRKGGRRKPAWHMCSLKLSANALTLAAGGGPANLVGFLKGRVGIRGIQTDTVMQITLQQALWLLLGSWFIYSSKQIWKAIRKWLNGTSSPWSRACFSPGENSGQNPSRPDSHAMPRESHEGPGAPQEAVPWMAACMSLFAFLCFSFFLPLTEMSECPWPLGEALALWAILFWAIWKGSREVQTAVTKGLH